MPAGTIRASRAKAAGVLAQLVRWRRVVPSPQRQQAAGRLGRMGVFLEFYTQHPPRPVSSRECRLEAVREGDRAATEEGYLGRQVSGLGARDELIGVHRRERLICSRVS